MSTTVHVQKRTGRPMQPGTLMADSKGRTCIFLTYCDHGDKVALYKDEIPPLVRRWDKSRKTIRMRVYRRLLNHMKDNVDY